MAILKSVVDVNNGNTGWTKTDVVDALETVFANLGWNNGTSASGVPCIVKPPGYTTGGVALGTEYQWNGGNSRVANFEHCGGPSVTTQSWKYRYFNVSNNSTTAYRMLEEFRFTTSNVDNADETITIIRHGLQTGDSVHYAPGVSSPDANKVMGGLSADTVYSAIRVDDDKIKLAANATDAGNGVAIDITSASQDGYYLQRPDDAAYDNYTINLKMGDRIIFNSTGASGAGGTFNIIYNNDSYDANKLLASFDANWQTSPTGQGTTTTEWNTRGYRQTEDEVLRPNRWVGEGAGTSTGDLGIIKYIYANDTNASMKGEIVLEPFISNNGASTYHPYWKYTVPADGGRSELKLRIYRGNQWFHNPYLVNITIHSIGSGWTNDAVFTIPGTAIGGASPANDVVFGVNADESSSNAYDGTPSIAVTNLGSGSNFWQKHPQGYYGLARVDHDAAKAYGTTYYGFGFDPDNDYQICITSGSNWDYLNREGIHRLNSSSDSTSFGVYEGEPGLDYSSGMEYLRRHCNDSDHRLFNYASNATPTAYPLQIRVYRAQAPQDTNFAIIQFAQVINGIIQPYATINLAKGTSFGAGVYDLDYVYQDALTEVRTDANRSIDFVYGDTGYEIYRDMDEPANTENGTTKCRAASYGYLRDTSDSNTIRQRTRFSCNIDTSNDSTDQIVTYYRNNDYDNYNGQTISASANYYKPIKGLPISNKLLPVPYYLPDDFVMLQVATTPGLVAFRTGDTITISGSEIYEIITASYQSQQNGLDQVNNNSTIGMLFMARTT